jgi:hypothetical protein
MAGAREVLAIADPSHGGSRASGIVLSLLHPFFDCFQTETQIGSYSPRRDFALLNKLVEGRARDPQHLGHFVGCQHLIHYRQGNHRLGTQGYRRLSNATALRPRFPSEDGAISVPALRGVYEAPITSRNLKLIERRNMPEKGWGYINRRNGGRRPRRCARPSLR